MILKELWRLCTVSRYLVIDLLLLHGLVPLTRSLLLEPETLHLINVQDEWIAKTRPSLSRRSRINVDLAEIDPVIHLRDHVPLS